MRINDTSGPISPFGQVTPSPQRATATGADFGRVYDLTARRAERSREAIPTELWDEIERASSLADQLVARGRELRFETHHLSGRVVANLCDSGGHAIRPVGLTELLAAPTAGLVDEGQGS